MSIHTILKQYWGYDNFRPMQEEIIRKVLEGKDVLALLPTGGGKSLCFQVPAMLLDGLCLVVSPLIALMKDQVENLQKKGITAFAIYAGMSKKEVFNTLEIAAESNCKFLYVSPERLETATFLSYLPMLNVQLIAVDEAHCISQWGYDFRPPYLRIADIREELKGVPILALTASATPVVQQDICEKLLFIHAPIFRQSFARHNLSYSVLLVEVKINKLVNILQKVQGSSIVYCKSRRLTADVAAQLQSYGISADYYHAGLTADVRTARQENWKQNKTRVMVCTNAFGMGIDKPDVRTVIHYNAPDCLENYYQEAGRAGRDGNKAYAILLYRDKDIEELEMQADIKFPPIIKIKEVYQGIVNYLQMPAGIGAGEYYNFDIADYIKKFSQPASLVANVLRVLAAENILSYSEDILLPSKVMFTTNRDNLLDFEKRYPLLEPVIKGLLRTYEGIWDAEISINEKSLAYNLKMEVSEINTALQQLQQARIIFYQYKKDTPQLYFLQNRVKAADLTIDEKQYHKRKLAYIKRVKSFINYIESTSCRSQIIGNYFGDESIAACGICNNCIAAKQVPLGQQAFKQIEVKLLQLLSSTPTLIATIVHQLDYINKEHLWEVINFLQKENKIKVSNGNALYVD